MDRREIASFVINDMYSCMEIAYLLTLLVLPSTKQQATVSPAIKDINYITIHVDSRS